jgi:hypothetical protein
MPIFNSGKELPLDKAYSFGSEYGLQDEISIIQNMEINWGPAYRSTIRRGFIIALFSQRGIFDAFIEKYWPNGNTKDGAKRIRSYLAIKKYLDIENSASPEGKELAAKENAKKTLIIGLSDVVTHLGNLWK